MLEDSPKLCVESTQDVPRPIGTYPYKVRQRDTRLAIERVFGTFKKLNLESKIVFDHFFCPHLSSFIDRELSACVDYLIENENYNNEDQMISKCAHYFGQLYMQGEIDEMMDYSQMPTSDQWQRICCMWDIFYETSSET